jgi:hypothetical protein
MRFLRLVPLLGLPLLLLGATCVNRVEQKGPTGPWVGEVTNNGPDPVSYTIVAARVFDANGQEFGDFGVSACPPSLLPGEKGTFELSFSADLTGLALPLRAQFNPLVQAESGFGLGNARDGLTATLLAKDPQGQYIIAEISNSSLRTYSELTVCANLRTPNGRLVEVGSGSPFPNVIHPGEKRTVTIFISSMTDGFFELFPSGNPDCCSGEITLDPALFYVTAQKVVTGPQGRELRVVGELDNTSAQDLLNVELQAYVEGEMAFPAWVSVGCGGAVGYGAKGPAAFSLALPPGAKPSVVIAGIQGSGNADINPVPVSDVTSTQRGEDTMISATLSNPTNSWLSIGSACFNLRDKHGTLVGTTSTTIGSYLAPGATLLVSATVSPLATGAKSAEVISYAEVLDVPPPSPLPPVP